MKRPVNLWFAIVGLSTNKLRAALTTLGIIIGVAAVIIIVSLGDGLRRSTEKQMEAFSSGTIEVRAMQKLGMPIMLGEGVSKEEIMRMSSSLQPQRMPQLSARDVEALRRLATSALAIAPVAEAYGTVVRNGKQVSSDSILGVTADLLATYRREMKLGRFFNQADQESAAPVAVLDEGMANRVFASGEDPLGQLLHVTTQGVTHNLTVIGVLRKRGEADSSYGSVYVPLRTAQMRLSAARSDDVSLIAVRVDSRKSADRQFAVAQINTILRARHRLAQGAPEDFDVNDTLSFREEMSTILNTITAILSLIAGISLIVGSIGLMNIMLVSVSERTWEIGLRRAVGAQQGDILAQFLAEAVLLSLVGGAIGLALGVAGSYGVSLAVEPIKGMVRVTPEIVLIALGVSSVVGIVAGIYPAWRAALLQPRAALRHL